MSGERDLAGRLDDLLQKIGLLVHRQKNEFAEENGISRQQLEVLNVIYAKGQITMGELCKEISSACSTATDLADKLEKAGYAERVREKKDRRVVRLKILPPGEELIKSIREKRIQSLIAGLQSLEQSEDRSADRSADR
ncbi:MAG: MarR family transcriptional regulator, partial [Peptococcaceae bacterium]|nr:MarR family transcriptional regulator [Peptococcaceae bacterium]